MTELQEGNQEVQKYIPSNDSYLSPRLNDLVLKNETKKQIDDLYKSMCHPQIFEILGIQPDKSILLQGSPGTGKTMSVTAIRNELCMCNHKITFMPYDIGNYGTAYINMGSVTLQKFFDVGRKYAKEGQIVMYFFDEADNIMSQRNNHHSSHKEDDKLLSTMMTNLQKINEHGTNEYCFFATNFTEGMDEAAIRAGRVDRIIKFELPDDDMILKALDSYESKANIKVKYELFRSIDNSKLLRYTKGFNYADISTLIKSTIRAKAISFLDGCNNETDNNGVIQPPTICTKDLEVMAQLYVKQRDVTKKGKRKIGY